MSKDQVFYRYKYVEFSQNSLKIITDGTIKFTCPLDFNDPFDCRPYLLVDDDVVTSKPFKIAQKYKKLSPAEKIKQKPQMLKNLKNAIDSGEHTKIFLQDLGVLSLSRTANNILMWSHYADNHRGFVVEFKYDMDILSSKAHRLESLFPIPVEYETSRPIHKMSERFDPTKHFLTKSIDWKYEQEERVITTNEGHGVHPYNRKEILNAVVAGAKMSDKDFESLRNAVEKASCEIGREIKIKKAKVSDYRYEVII